MKHFQYLWRKKGAASFSDNIILFFVIVLLLCIAPASLYAQDILDKPVSLDVRSQSMNDVLEIISNQGNFYFSYNSNIIRRDSPVTLSVANRTVKQVLDLLFRGNYQQVNILVSPLGIGGVPVTIAPAGYKGHADSERRQLRAGIHKRMPDGRVYQHCEKRNEWSAGERRGQLCKKIKRCADQHC